MTQAQGGGLLLTLHYRIRLEDGTEVLSTFGGHPATLALGQGELAPALEARLAGLAAGAHHSFELEPDEAFGARRDDLVQALPRGEFPAGMALAQGVVIEFSAPGGVRRAARVQALDDHEVLVDFNHPLAGRRLSFEVEVLAVV